MRKLLFAALMSLIPGIGWAGNATLNVTIPGSGTPLGFYQNASTYYPENVITNPLVPTQNWLIDSRGYGPMTEADGANVTLGSVSDPVYTGSGSSSAIGLLKGIYAAATAPIVNLPSSVDVNTGAAGASTLRFVPATTTEAASCASGTSSTACLRQIDVDVKSPGPVFGASLTITALDVTTVTTGGTAVTAIASGHRTKGGFITNPDNASEVLCINEVTTASGTHSNGTTVCIPAGNTYQIAPSTTSVSVVAATSSHAFAGEVFN